MSEDSGVFAFSGGRLILRVTAKGLRLPLAGELSEAMGGEKLERARVAVAVRDGRGGAASVFGLDEKCDLPEDFRVDGLRVAWHALDADEFRVAGTARQKLEWVQNHRFCSRCGAETRPDEVHEAMTCVSCHQLHYPRIAPAVIVLVQRGREALLGRSHRFVDGVYSTLAGFVEPGESLEDCVHREIEEEVGVTVDRLRYFGSQPHPFPHSLMVGFIADWAEGDIRIDTNEIEDARWFDADQLPELPHPMSIARALIEDFRRRASE